MLDIQLLRNNLDEVKAALAKRGGKDFLAVVCPDVAACRVGDEEGVRLPARRLRDLPGRGTPSAYHGRERPQGD